jgi:ribose 1,5-bisphosphokinase PhnN
MTRSTGAVIVLNGPSSAGKSTLAAALRRRFAADGECWFVEQCLVRGIAAS